MLAFGGSFYSLTPSPGILCPIVLYLASEYGECISFFKKTGCTFDDEHLSPYYRQMREQILNAERSQRLSGRVSGTTTSGRAAVTPGASDSDPQNNLGHLPPQPSGSTAAPGPTTTSEKSAYILDGRWFSGQVKMLGDKYGFLKCPAMDSTDLFPKGKDVFLDKKEAQDFTVGETVEFQVVNSAGQAKAANLREVEGVRYEGMQYSFGK